MVRTSHQPITGDPIRETFTALRCVRDDGLFAREGWAAAVGKCLRKEIPSLRCVRDYGPPLVQGGAAAVGDVVRHGNCAAARQMSLFLFLKFNS